MQTQAVDYSKKSVAVVVSTMQPRCCMRCGPGVFVNGKCNHCGLECKDSDYGKLWLEVAEEAFSHAVDVIIIPMLMAKK